MTARRILYSDDVQVGCARRAGAKEGPCNDFFRHLKQQGPKPKPCKNPAETSEFLDIWKTWCLLCFMTFHE